MTFNKQSMHNLRKSYVCDIDKDPEDIFEGLTKQEIEKTIRMMNGNETVADLRAMLDEMIFKTNVYEYVLQKHYLLQEAEREMTAARQRSIDFVSQLEKQEVRI